MKNLFIIGNGFDIHHGINSRYSDYREWLKGYDFDLYNKLCRLYDSTEDDDDWWNSLNNIYLQLVLIILIGYIKIMVQYMEVKILVMLTITELPYN